MPFVRITHAQGALSPDQQAAMLHGVHEAVVAVEGEALRMGVGVVLETGVASTALVVNCLPFIAITLVRDALSAEQRATMISSVVEAVVAVEGESARPRTWVVIEESVASGEWSIGGRPLTLAALESLKQGRNPWS